ncbi:uncharacterized protein LOC105202949 [Solenopsis invicta]|uniref:uncharacterized protein LOC105202949 n=1 Tax=Solenopsis invicta TaxID=13686 RepID=UPI0005962273|nr:uncharacterized protein LOC105202949 [Solenopsis invicta]
MYRQILLNVDQRDLQRILWRTTSEQIQAYRLNTVTYGLASAPFLAIRCLHQFAIEHKDTLPEASAAIQDFYVDDLITGGNDLNQLKTLKEDVTRILRSGGFEMHKWNSNKNLISNEDNEETSESVNFNKEYRINLKPHLSKFTKRVILSVASQIFDPLGSIGPITVQSKLLLQNLWRSKVGWDDPVPAELQSKWTHFCAQLQSISNISIPRYAFSNDCVFSELHGFCDASKLAYGCCFYIKTENSRRDTTVNLLCAKSRVAPVKSISLPRLKLSAALLLARLYQQVTKALTIKPTSTHDSTITLAWIR